MPKCLADSQIWSSSEVVKFGAWKAIRGTLRESFGRPKVAVYTAITGSYDTLSAPAMRVPGWDYLCFSDQPSVARPGWEVCALPQSDLDPARLSRLPKILPHHFLFDYDISIWIDANISIIGDLAGLCKIALAGADVAHFRHGLHRPSVAAEIVACRDAGKAPLDVMTRQYEAYRANGFPDNAGIIPEGGVIVRRHHRPLVRDAMQEWWAELLSHSARDQISLPYIIWRRSLNVKLLDWDLRTAPWFRYGPHDAPAMIGEQP